MALFEDDIHSLLAWMTDRGNINKEVAFWIHKYIMLSGETTMSALGEMSQSMMEVVSTFDEIRWVEMMHGCLPVALCHLQ